MGHLLENKFIHAAFWVLFAAVASLVGVIHAPRLDPWASDKRYPLMYLLSALVLLLAHAIQNRAEQLKEMQVRWSRALVKVKDRVVLRCSCLERSKPPTAVPKSRAPSLLALG